MVDVNALRMTDNFLDISHFPYVHTGTFGIADEHRRCRSSRSSRSTTTSPATSYEVEVANDARQVASSGLDADVIKRRMTTGFALPFTVRSTIHYETGLDHIILLCTTPIDDVRCYFTFVIWRNDDFTSRPRRSSPSTGRSAPRTSGCWSGCPACCRSTNTATVSVQADRASVEWRRRLAASLAD